MGPGLPMVRRAGHGCALREHHHFAACHAVLFVSGRGREEPVHAGRPGPDTTRLGYTHKSATIRGASPSEI
jgi:hypothetical protein